MSPETRPVVLAALVALPAAAQDLDPTLVEEGRRLFMEETFGGNGRTCVTCHDPRADFGLTPELVQSLRGNDPLFVAKGKLKGLERQQGYLKNFLLILENTDGFSEASVERTSQQLVGLATSLAPPGGFPFPEALGWSGDGSPDGTLFRFAEGAIKQHFPKSLDRVEGVDFVLPSEHQLAALEAFQLSIGPATDPNVNPNDPDRLRFDDPVVERGLELFHGAETRTGATRSCAGCHHNAGALTAAGTNGQFDTGVALLPDAPACLPSSTAPGDGGFGATPVEVVPSRDLCGQGKKRDVVFQGDGAFNTRSAFAGAVEPPFFHNGAVDTVEGAVAFYTGDTFDASPAGRFGGGAFALDQGGVDAVAAFLRALDAAHESIPRGVRYLEEALPRDLASERAREDVAFARAEAGQALDALTGGPFDLFPGTGAVEALEAALAALDEALGRSILPADLLEAALARLEEARAAMLQG